MGEGDQPVQHHDSTRTAVEAFRRGYQPVPIRDGDKRPFGAAWTQMRWESEEQIAASFDRWAETGAGGVGLLLGEPSHGLVDIDLDHPLSLRLRDYFLPPTPMQTGRPGRPRSHRWYRVTDDVPSTRRYKMPDRSVSVELRASGAQTVIPPSVHPSGESYRWEGTAWGGKRGPAETSGRKLAVQVALLGLGAVLIENWPRQGSRHEAYLALAGGLLRFGTGVHPYWERNLPVLIEALADATHDDDGPETRVSEVMGSTLATLREGGKATGFPRLAEFIGNDHAELARRMAREVEQLGGFDPASLVTVAEVEEPLVSTLPPENRNPMEERITSWDAVDLEPYLSGQIVMPEPTVLQRSDGKGLFYPGRVNSLYGMSESGKSWMSLVAAVQEMGKGERVVYIDFEDEPAGTLSRLRALGVGDDDVKDQFRYVHPEGPLAEMQRYQFGSGATEEGKKSSAVFRALLESFDPTLVVADGMTVLYGLHGHDTNQATGTDVITSWLKSLCRGGRTTVIVIDHTGKGSGPGASPIGAHHKVAMVQGTSIRVDAVDRPMPGAVGRMRLVVHKDRPGVVRSYSTRDSEQVAGEAVMDSTVEGMTKIVIDPVPEGTVVVGDSPGMEAELQRLSRVGENATKVLAQFGGDLDKTLTTTEVCKGTGLDPNEVYDVWAELTRTGTVVREGANRWTRFRLADPAKEKGEGHGEAEAGPASAGDD